MKMGNRTQETRGRKRKPSVLLVLSLILVSGILPLAAGTEHGVKIEDAYVRVAAEGMMSAAYFTIINTSEIPDTLYGVKANFAEMAQLHKSYRKNGMVGMKQVMFVVVPAESSFEFKPGSYHVMLMNLKENLKIGRKVELELLFKRSGAVMVEASVRR